ncbi:tRNA epoxyqueuosine(34) reductase QueG [Nitratireductor alexandrii]|uniref:tRNA epoxyqueuosine(34) reductase QueG n=1 Tax=Nitratireductor alexandrii TaxID=2448161 RepID=UPI000FDC2C81|nr:tRNA epoxyqueuosine(34) reductase QueG [Nitratireductor alexandrii]
MSQSARPTTSPLRTFLDREAAAVGFDLVRVVRPDAVPDLPQRLRQFVDDGHHATMGWLAERMEARAAPHRLWPEVRSVIMLAMNYGPDHNPLADLARTSCGVISVYAQNRDYHDVVKGKLKQLAGKLAARAGADVKVFVDTAPVMEKPLAAAAGLGWQGKHTNLVSRSHGSWLFLGSIFTTAFLEADSAEADHCGRCRACLDICPTNAFPAPYRLDAGRCISYLTIEHHGPIPRALRPAIGNRIYGCDDCLAVCPWNKFARCASEAKLAGRADRRAPALRDLLALDDAAFRSLFSGSPVKRTGRDRFVRNALVAAGNSGDAALVPACRSLLDDAAPVVRGAAVWALSRLLPAQDFLALAAALAADADQSVREEWQAACAAARTGNNREFA